MYATDDTNPDDLFKLSLQEKEKADQVQPHQPWRQIHLANAQIYALWAIYAQGSREPSADRATPRQEQ